MKIVIATPLYPPDLGGPAKYAKALKEEFERQGHRVRVVAYGSLERALPPIIKHAVYGVRLVYPMLTSQAVIVLDTWLTGFPALILAKVFGVKVLVRIGGDTIWEWYVDRTGEMVKLSLFYAHPHKLSLKEQLMHKGTALLLRYADVLAFTTRWQQELWQKGFFFDPARAKVVENFYPVPASVTPATKRIFIAAGRTTVLKNQKGLHEAFAAVKAKYPDIELDERVLDSKLHTERLGGCYAVVVASISEVNPNTAIEAAAARKPFIAPEDCGGKERLMGMGLFVDTANTRALRDALEKLLEPAAYAGYVEASEALKPHSWEEIAREYVALLS